MTPVSLTFNFAYDILVLAQLNKVAGGWLLLHNLDNRTGSDPLKVSKDRKLV